MCRQDAADPAFAAKVGANLVMIHADTAGQSAIASDFNDDALFRAIRLEPYLEFTGQASGNCRCVAEPASIGRCQNRKALVHGDVSPKNILPVPTARCSWTPNVPGSAIRHSTSPSASTISC